MQGLLEAVIGSIRDMGVFSLSSLVTRDIRCKLDGSHLLRNTNVVQDTTERGHMQGVLEAVIGAIRDMGGVLKALVGSRGTLDGNYTCCRI